MLTLPGVIPIDRLTDVRAPTAVIAQRISRQALEEAYSIRLPKPSGHEAAGRCAIMPWEEGFVEQGHQKLTLVRLHVSRLQALLWSQHAMVQTGAHAMCWGDKACQVYAGRRRLQSC